MLTLITAGAALAASIGCGAASAVGGVGQPTVTSLSISPANGSVNALDTLRFAAVAAWSDGGNRPVTVSWSGTGGSVDQNGLFTAGPTPGTFQVVAALPGGVLADTATVTVASAGGGAILVSEGFEGNSLAARGWFDTPTVTTVPDARPGSTGSRVLQWHWTAGAISPQGSSRIDFTPSTSVYLSYWIKQSANWVGSGQSFHPHMFHFLTTVDDHYIGPSRTHLTLYDELIYQTGRGGSQVRLALQDALMIDTSKLMVDLTNVTEQRAIGGYNGRPEQGLFWDAYDAGGGAYTNYKMIQPATMLMTDATKNAWHHVESYWQLNTISGGKGQPDGIVRYWFDGTLIVERQDLYFRTNANPSMKFRTFVMAPYIGSGSPRDQYLWIDDLLVATAKP